MSNMTTTTTRQELTTPTIPMDTTWDAELTEAVQAYNDDVVSVRRGRIQAETESVMLLNDALGGTIDAQAARERLTALRDGLLQNDLEELAFVNRLPELIARIRTWHRAKSDDLHQQSIDRRAEVEQQAQDILHVTRPGDLHRITASDDLANQLKADARAHQDRVSADFGMKATEARNVELCSKIAGALRL